MSKLFYCEYKVNRNFACRYVFARNSLHACDLLIAHYALLSPYLNVTDISVKLVEYLSTTTIKHLNQELYGNDK